MPPLHPPGALQGGRAAAYLRVSTPEQGYDLQRAAVLRAAAQRGETENLEFFSETRSGRSWVRPELDRMCSRLAEFERIYVWRLDRLTRRGPHDTLQVVERIRGAGCQLVSVTEGFDFGGPVGELLVAMLGFAAALEMAAQIDRQQAARARMEADGIPWGRPPKMPAETAEKIRLLRGEGRSIRSIAMAVKVPRSSVFDALK